MQQASLRVVLIHGLPDRPEAPGQDPPDPIEQLQAIRAFCTERGIPDEPYRWATTSRETGRALLLLKRPDACFTLTYADRFHAWISGYLPTLPQDVSLAIVAYSAGGAFFYRWVDHHATTDQLKRISVAVLIAAPLRFPTVMVLENRPFEVIMVAEPPVQNPPLDLVPNAIADKLAAAGTQLKVVLAGCDLTIPLTFATFPEPSSADQVLVRFSTHLDICRHQDLLQAIDRWLH